MGEDLDAITRGIKKKKREPFFGSNDAIIKSMVDKIPATGGSVNKHAFAGLVTGTLQANAAYLLKAKSGTIDPNSDSLRQSFYRRHKLVKRRQTSSRSNLSQEQKESAELAFCNSVNSKIIENDILDALIINFDETSLPVTPAQSYTMEQRGAKTLKLQVLQMRETLLVFLPEHEMAPNWISR